MISANKNTTYISKTSANELINHCGKEILSILLKRINQAKYYCSLFDETTDVSYIYQLSSSIRYIFKNNNREDFISFVDIHRDNYETCNILGGDVGSDSDIVDEPEPTITGEILGLTVVKKWEV